MAAEHSRGSRSAAERCIVVVWQMGGYVDDEEFVGPFRTRARAEKAAQRIERVAARHGVEGIATRVRTLYEGSISGSEIAGWYP